MLSDSPEIYTGLCQEFFTAAFLVGTKIKSETFPLDICNHKFKCFESENTFSKALNTRHCFCSQKDIPPNAWFGQQGIHNALCCGFAKWKVKKHKCCWWCAVIMCTFCFLLLPKFSSKEGTFDHAWMFYVMKNYISQPALFCVQIHSLKLVPFSLPMRFYYGSP